MKTITLFTQTFQCTDQAATVLQSYIDGIKEHFSSRTEYDADVVEDILIACEQKIITLLASRADQTLYPDDIQSIIRQLGSVEQMDESDDDIPLNSSRITASKLYRDPQHAIFGGVCAGLAAYFGMPVRAMRLITILLVFTPMPVLIAYIILRFVIEPARTKSDYLRLYGKPVSLSTLSGGISDYTKRRVRSLAKTIFIIFGVIIAGVAALIGFVVVIGLFQTHHYDETTYVYQCDNQEVVRLTIPYGDVERVRFDSATIGGNYRYAPGVQPGQWVSQSLGVLINMDNDMELLTVTQSGSVIHDNCSLRQIYDTDGNASFFQMVREVVDQDTCLDEGNVWDEDQKKCRDDMISYPGEVIAPTTDETISTGTTIYPSREMNDDGINDCEGDGSCDHTINYSQDRPIVQ